ncbi:MAG: collagen-like protein [Candidatus Stahlbacteria bacterium]|nr:MAG: collagen-like protein [Candidatus Stahlbacteria bacterium]
MSLSAERKREINKLISLKSSEKRKVLRGERGLPGREGKQGRDGKSGIDGDKGLDGLDGRDGKQGPQGIPGINGKDGINGKQGLNGISGKDGKDGLNGKDGEKGEQGERGEKGESGPRGKTPITSGGTMSAGTLLEKLLTVDGDGSGLDADKLDGAQKDTDGTLSGNSDDSIPTEKAVKNYVDNTRHLPIGTIIMFDANHIGGGSGGASGAWTDNSTLPGWYACISGNDSWNCPNLVDRFVMGKVVAGAGTTGGSNTRILVTANMPSHRHYATHNHGAKTSGNPSANHSHAYYRTGTRYNTTAGTITDESAKNRNWVSVSSGTVSAWHTHTTDLPIIGHYSDYQGSGSSFDNRPAYYSIIFIRKCI